VTVSVKVAPNSKFWKGYATPHPFQPATTMFRLLKPTVFLLIAKNRMWWKVKLCAQLHVERGRDNTSGQVDAVFFSHNMLVGPCATAQALSILGVFSRPFCDHSLFLVTWLFTDVWRFKLLCRYDGDARVDRSDGTGDGAAPGYCWLFAHGTSMEYAYHGGSRGATCSN
jgi:hypothetical protein